MEMLAGILAASRLLDSQAAGKCSAQTLGIYQS